MRNYYYTLEHSGTKGMKWGRRLYQNPDGSLTPLGRVRYAKRKREADKKRRASLEKARAEKTRKAAHEAEKQKALKSGSAEDVLKFKGELTEQELKTAAARIRAENDLASLKTSPKTSAGKKFVKTVFNDVVAPVAKETAKNVAKDYLTKKAKDYLGLNEKKNPEQEEMDKLKREVETLDLQERLRKHKEPKQDNSAQEYHDNLKRQYETFMYEDKLREKIDERNKRQGILYLEDKLK